MIPLEKTYTVHLPFKNPIATLVISKSFNKGHYNVGFSTCHNNDQFNRKLGRQIAYNRLLFNENTGVFGDFGATPTDLFKYLSNYYYFVINRKDSHLYKLIKKVSDDRFQFFDNLKTVFDTLDVRMKGK